MAGAVAGRHSSARAVARNRGCAAGRHGRLAHDNAGDLLGFHQGKLAPVECRELKSGSFSCRANALIFVII
jgi:hypothetical protein